MRSQHVAIVGAGMAGLACAEKLVAAGCDVRLFDKGRGPGGRMSTRRIQTTAGEAAFDHGAQYLTARDPAFQQRLVGWQQAGLVAHWPAAGEDAWVGTPSMHAPLKAMGESLAVRWNTRVDGVASDQEGWHLRAEIDIDGRFDTLVIAVPAEQAPPLLSPWDAAMARMAEATRSEPCWTLMAAFAEFLPIDADVVQNLESIGWAARNSAKAGRSGPESWVIQANPAWSAANLESSAAIIAEDLLGRFFAETGIAPRPTLALAAHRWRYARSGSAGQGQLWNGELRLGACGDWLLEPRVECAWLSGNGLAETIIAAGV